MKKLSCALLFCLLIVAAGCRSSTSKKMAAEQALKSSASDTRLQLENHVTFISTQIERACDLIAQDETDPSIRRNTVYFKIRSIPSTRRSLDRADEQAVMFDLWMKSEMFDRWAGSPEGTIYFGERYTIMADAAHVILKSSRSLAKAVLTPEQYEVAEKEIASFISAHAVDENLSVTEESKSDWGKAMTRSLGKPLSVVTKPLAALDFSAGVDDVAVAGLQMAAEVDRVETTVRYLPTDIRWQIQLLLLEVEENLDLESVVESVAKVGESSERLSKTAEDLPSVLRTELSALIEDVDAKQANLQQTVEDVNTLVASTNTTAATLVETGNALTQTFEALNAMLITVMGPPPGPDDPPPPPKDPNEESKPFDITEYGATAAQLTETANALTALLAEAKEVEETVAPALIEDTESMVRSIVNQAFLAGGLFVLFTAVVMLSYKLLARRMASPGAG